MGSKAVRLTIVCSRFIGLHYDDRNVPHLLAGLGLSLHYAVGSSGTCPFL